MAVMGDPTVTIRVVDEVTPVLWRLSHIMFWMAYGRVAMTMLWIATIVLAFIIGLLVGH